ncbi:hypothetical protein ACQZ3V_01770 [Ralstonia pseudosolanacearum]|uniref:hypothetical protein n=1 Tax=Ralstonia pseudosolanacearum TaxID=1310165 RepID=UPI001FF832D5
MEHDLNLPAGVLCKLLTAGKDELTALELAIREALENLYPTPEAIETVRRRACLDHSLTDEKPVRVARMRI